MKKQILNALALAIVSIISAALVAYLKDPKLQASTKASVKAFGKKARKYVKRQASFIELK